MHTHRYTVNPRALLGYTSLTAPERNALESALDTLADLPEKKWRTAGAVPLGSAEPMYFLRLDDSLRAIIQPSAGGKPELLDLVRHELLEWMFKRPGNKASQE